MTELMNQLGEPKLMRDKGKARAVEDEEEESDQEDGDEDETNEQVSGSVLHALSPCFACIF